MDWLPIVELVAIVILVVLGMFYGKGVKQSGERAIMGTIGLLRKYKKFNEDGYLSRDEIQELTAIAAELGPEAIDFVEDLKEAIEEKKKQAKG